MCIVAQGFQSACQLKLLSAQVVLLSGLGLQAAGTQISVQLSAVRLPRYRGTLSQFLNVTTMIGNYVIDTGSLQPVVQFASPIQSVNLMSGSLQNSAITWLQLSFQIPNGVLLTNSDQLLIQLPQSIQFQSSTLCQLEGGVQQNCTILAQNNSVLIQSDLSKILERMTVNITNLVNQVSFQPAQGFVIQLVDQSQRLVANYSQSNLTYTMNTASNLAVSMLQQSTVENATTNYTFQSQKAFGFTLITFPLCMQFNQSSLSIVDQIGVTILFSLQSTQSISLNATSTAVTIIGLRNPSEACIQSGQPIKIQTFSDAKLMWLTSQQTLIPSLSCSALCSSCQTNNRTYCNSCPQPQTALNGVCLDQCPSGFFSLLGQCQKCQDGCQSCQNQTTCTKCSPDRVYTKQGSCITSQQCQSIFGMFVQSATCTTCSVPCLSCGPDGQCLQCSNQTYLLDGMCQNTCPDFYKLNGNICEKFQTSELVLGLFLALPCMYTYLVVFIILALIKLILKSQISLVMTNLMCVSTMMFGSVAYVSYQNIILYQQEQSVLQCILAFVPVYCCVLQLIFNVWISIVHRVVLRYGGYQTSTLIYFPSVFLTYHCLSQLKLDGEKDEQPSSVVKSLIKYLKQYSIVSYLNINLCLMPCRILLTYQSLSTDNEFLSQDASLMLAFTTLWTQLALYYPPEDNIIQVYVLEKPDPEEAEQTNEFKLAKNSIQIHMMKQISRKTVSDFTTVQKLKVKSVSEVPHHAIIKSSEISLSNIEIEQVSKTPIPQPTRARSLFEPNQSGCFSSSEQSDQNFEHFADVAIKQDQLQQPQLHMSFDCGETTIDKTHDIMIEDSFRDTQIPPKYLERTVNSVVPQENKPSKEFMDAIKGVESPEGNHEEVADQVDKSKRSFFSKK